MAERSEQVNESGLKSLIIETKVYFSQLVYRLDRLKDDMEGGFNDSCYLLNELNYRI